MKLIINYGRVIQVCFSQRGKILGSWMNIVIVVLIFFCFCSLHYFLEAFVYLALKVSLEKCFMTLLDWKFKLKELYVSFILSNPCHSGSHCFSCFRTQTYISL